MRDVAPEGSGHARVEPRRPRILPYVLVNLALAAICLAVAKVSSGAAVDHRVATALWPLFIALFVIANVSVAMARAEAASGKARLLASEKRYQLLADQEHGQSAVVESQAQLEQLSRLLITAQEDERRRVAREVHDELGQALAAVKIGLATSETVRRKPGESSARLLKASGLLDQAMGSVQQIVLRLRPGVLDDLGPLAALEYEVQQFRERSGITITLALPPEPLVIRDDQSTALYRTVQEALTNILKHAQAAHVSVTLLALEHELVLQVVDDGVGIAADQLMKPRSLGLLGMRERAAACDGSLAISSGDESGTCLILRLNRIRAPEVVA